MDSTCQIDDLGPLPVLRPGSVAELCELVRESADADLALYPLGGRTGLGFGKAPRRPGRAIDLTALDQVTDYPARDMTATVQTGIPMSRLQAHLATERLQLAVDVPLADRATLGGAIAINASGPRRLGHGTLRDQIIGIRFVNDEAQEVKAGGRVVKNVAGYDLCKLQIGALGTLGILTEVTVKLRPLPEQRSLVVVPATHAGDLDALLDRVHVGRSRPMSVTVVSPSVSPSAGWAVIVGFEGSAETVRWQAEQLQRELSPTWQPQPPRIDEAGDTLRQALIDFPRTGDAELSFKANLVPSVTAAFCQRASSLFGNELRLQAEAGNGIVHGHAPAGITLDAARTALSQLRELAVRAHGNLVLPRCPTAWKADLPIWGQPRGDLALMRSVKRALDPRDRFNPGRFLV